MLSIGEFSKICMVSTKALRHYDSIGLIKPMLVNAENGYRFYDSTQLNDMLLINRLKRFGFGLQEIDKLLKANDRAYLAACLNAQRMLLAKQIEQQQEAIEELDCYLTKIERKDQFMNDYDISIVNVANLPILSIREHISSEEYGKQFGRLHERLTKENIAPLVHMAIYHDSEYDPGNSDIEIAIAIGEEDKADRTLKGCECAHLTHVGSYATLSEAYASIMRWIENNAYAIASAPYEKYIIGPGCSEPASEWVTEIYFPIKKK